MCEPATRKIHNWKGWSDLPAPRIGSRAIADNAPWIDLSHPVTETLSRIPFFPQPTFRKLQTKPPANSTVTEIQMVVHFGTHLDAPCHFVNGAPTMDQVPLDRFYGQGVIWRIDTRDRAAVDVAELERAKPRMQAGDIVLIDTGWWRYINTDRYEEHPFLTGEASEWLVAQGAKLVGVDYSSPDQAAHYRSKEYDFPVHNTLLSSGVLIAEHLTNLTPLAGRRVEIMFLGINIVGSDGTPARPVARPLD
jgi:kynurenine formamidase